MVDTVYCTIHFRSMQAKCIMILYVTLNQDNELGPTRILRIYNHVLYTLCTLYSSHYRYVCEAHYVFLRIIGGLAKTIYGHSAGCTAQTATDLLFFYANFQLIFLTLGE